MKTPGPLIGDGRAAQVFACGNGKVLRRYRGPHPTFDEAALMQYVFERGFPAPRIFEATGTDLVMERIDGPTMLDDLTRRPWKLRSHAATLAELHRRLGEIPAPDWLQQKIDGGRSVIHLDLHPGNVMLSRRGALVIDWTNAGAGPAEADVALTWLLLAAGEPPGGPMVRLVVGVARRSFLRSFLGHFDLAKISLHLAATAERRLLHDSNMRESELRRMADIVREAGSASE